ncbi:MAG: T9SS type A sorting domain-containing protein [Bacteroidetes bacterium]|nr:T9SS type A sorting domain-containing protein [Bacteroidota bacterium]
MPIQLLSFEAHPQNNQWIQLKWTTGSEINNKGFEVQRSLNGVDFEKIGWVNGAFNSQTKLNYAFDDRNVISGFKYYYRLNQVDMDGSNSYSKIRVASITNNDFGLIIYPIPTKDMLFLQSNQDIARYEITDAIGKICTIMDSDKNRFVKVDVLNYPEGTYFVKIFFNSGESIIKKWIKQ